MNKLIVIDYGISNLKSISNALEFLDIAYEITDTIDIGKSYKTNFKVLRYT